MSPNLIIVGASTRAAAQSALRAGWRPWCADLFADRDLAAIAPVAQIPSDLFPLCLPELLLTRGAPAHAPVLLTGAMENHLETVTKLAARHPMLGSSPVAMQAVRASDWWEHMPALAGVVHPARTTAAFAAEGIWLVKPRRSAAGHGIHWWDGRTPVDGGQVLQQFITGISASAHFRAAAETQHMCTLLGVTEQLVGVSEFGAAPFRYVGNIAPLPLSSEQLQSITQLGAAVADVFALTGSFGVDFILSEDGLVWPLEVNPRYTSGMEVVEQITGRPVLPICPHARATAAPALAHIEPPPAFAGKAIVYSQHAGHTPDLYAHLAPRDIADVPRPALPLHVGDPVCTVLAHAATRAAVFARLLELAHQVHTVVAVGAGASP